REEERKQRTPFAAVVDDYLVREVEGHDPARPLKRSAGKIRSTLTNILVPLFGARPLTELTADDLLPPLELIARLGTDRALVRLGARRALRRRGRRAGPGSEKARALYVFTKRLFNGALDLDSLQL